MTKQPLLSWPNYIFKFLLQLKLLEEWSRLIFLFIFWLNLSHLRQEIISVLLLKCALLIDKHHSPMSVWFLGKTLKSVSIPCTDWNTAVVHFQYPWKTFFFVIPWKYTEQRTANFGAWQRYRPEPNWRQFGCFFKTYRFTATFFYCVICIRKRCWTLGFTVCPFYPLNCHYSTVKLR